VPALSFIVRWESEPTVESQKRARAAGASCSVLAVGALRDADSQSRSASC
jgi:hypothetical protein